MIVFTAGSVDVYGFNEAVLGIFVGGWIAHDGFERERPECVVAYFADSTFVMCSLGTYGYRADVGQRGIGFTFFGACPKEPASSLLRLEWRLSTGSRSIRPGARTRQLGRTQLHDVLASFLSGGPEKSNRHLLRRILSGDAAAARHVSETTTTGAVDIYGYHASGGCWLFCGWGRRASEGDGWSKRAVATFENGSVDGEALLLTFPRADVRADCDGMIIAIQTRATQWLGGLCFLTLDAQDGPQVLVRSSECAHRRQKELTDALGPIVSAAGTSPARETVLSVLGCQPYQGRDTIADLKAPIFLGIDEAIQCGANGLLLAGWLLAKPELIKTMRLNCGPLEVDLVLRNGISVKRPDVIESVGAQHGYTNATVGFVLFVPHVIMPHEPVYITIETTRHEVGYRPVELSMWQGLAAIRRVLQLFEARFDEIPWAYDRVIGPAVALLNSARLGVRPAAENVEYGMQPSNPDVSVVVPVHGRLDLVECQLALLSAHKTSLKVEYIYVIDDPDKRREAQYLFMSLYERFHLPFRALMLDQNVGFAPACNIGLGGARGEMIAFVNSDVFPITPDWLERLAARLADNPELGVIAPLLLHEDGSIQHKGIYFESLPEFGGWYFGRHSDKWQRYVGCRGLQTCDSVTAACILMRRATADQLGGFDEAYVIGDFEDTDLCLRLRRRGLRCAVDHQVQLYHLERKSQAGPGQVWRMNLTLYNAWVHQSRWASVIPSENNDPVVDTAAARQ